VYFKTLVRCRLPPSAAKIMRLPLALLAVAAIGLAHAASALSPRAHVMTTHLQPAATYDRVCEQSSTRLSLRLLVKFKDGLGIRFDEPTGTAPSSDNEPGHAHLPAIHRVLAGAHATARPVLSSIGQEWERLVERAERCVRYGFNAPCRLVRSISSCS
jgi:hypothetical protein